ncbi:MAG: NAD(P)-dependent dehydrogenase (short-subunit alcohol dehydrogenase family) [Rickettsiales bacterium]|jgi:NAD(P)-dependent dehydrogenase (short-subunit alcohol dehydrogenase family)
MSLNIVITGASRGIGLSFCKYFSNLGHNVYGVCRKSSPDLKEVATTIIEDIDIGNPDS